MLPSGTVTFLFTDIEGSTKLWQQFPDAMPVALARHHELLTQSIERHSGYVFQIIGDAFCAAFATAFDGLDAALDAQRSLRDFEWGETGAIHVRMALHTGAAEVRAGEFTSGEYVSGITLSRAARLLSAGHGRQILLSSPSAELVREQLPPNIALRDMGAHRLKDLVQPQQIFQILAFDLPQEFPPLKTLDALPNNLPIQLTSFVGREREIAEITGLLTTDGRPQTTIAEAAVRRQSSGVESHSVIRLLTLTGAGGSGKTRLSLQVAAEVIDEFEKGAWFVELAPIAEASLVPNAVMSALGLREEAGRAPLDALTDFLRAKNLLLILDNCEHLIEASAQLAHHLLTHCPNLKILATSREGLGVAGEVTYAVPPLGIPEADDPSFLRARSRQTADDEYTARITQYDAVRLFIERAVAVQPNFSVTNANAPAVAQICFRLDGIPLALELAAARIKLFSPEQIAARLDDRFRLLTGGSRTAMPRQQTLRAAIEWSYSLLSDAERILFRRLAVFAGGWTFEAAEQVCADVGRDGISPYDVMELLAQLVNKSLVITEIRGDETRYRMLETIREYAHAKLQDAGEAEQVCQRHSKFFADLAEQANLQLTSPEYLIGIKRLDTERDNMRAALEWGVNAKSLAAVRIAVALGIFWVWRDTFAEARQWYERTLDANPDAPAQWRARVLAFAANYEILCDDPAQAYKYAVESLELARQCNDKFSLAKGLTFVGVAKWALGDRQGAMAFFDQALRFARETQDPNILGPLFLFWGHSQVEAGNFDQAQSLYQEAVAVGRTLQTPLYQALGFGGLGIQAFLRDDFTTARTALAESLRVAREIGKRLRVAWSAEMLARVYVLDGNPADARALLSEAVSIFRDLGLRKDLAFSLEGWARLALAQGDARRAARILGTMNLQLNKDGEYTGRREHTSYDQTLAAVQQQLDAATFREEWAAGEKLSLEQAIELAMQDE